jgi:hypothetical protein
MVASGLGVVNITHDSQALADCDNQLQTHCDTNDRSQPVDRHIHRSCKTVALLSLLRVQLSLQHNLKMKRDTGELASCTLVS